ncbi:MAG: TIGR03364 family FAD-dependent oxidoreductase [Pirellulaceae bacterium]|nr:TIGR03364 family FAD-dependent oxidoreductase [Pirellulaceae bacterium]
MNIAIVGAGIFGLAHAWAAAKRGHRVTVLERSARASGASIRNFGMVWPIGQPAGQWHEVALRSRQAWLEVAEQAGIWAQPCGSIHLAHRPDEWQVLQEFAGMAPALGFECELLGPQQVQARTPAANPQGLLGGLYSPSEVCVNPPATIRVLPGWLHEKYGVDFRFNTAVTSVSGQHVTTADSSASQGSLPFDRCLVCSGSDLKTLFPEVYQAAGLRLCKLQMLRTATHPNGWRIGTHLASGLTLGHYSCFEHCPSLTTLRARIAAETPELDQYGIHVMASQNDAGQVILGDSHEYDSEIEPFDKQIIDELILRELRRIIDLPEWSIEQRWHGYYCKYSKGPVLAAEPSDTVSIRTGAGGSGMTMSFGLAERDWEQWS